MNKSSSIRTESEKAASPSSGRSAGEGRDETSAAASGLTVVAPRVCVVCGAAHGFQWSDTHGIGVCHYCATPYTIFHYEGEGDDKKRVDKPPTCALDETGIALAKRYWAKTGRKVFPGCCDMGLLGHRDRTYSGATADDMQVFGDWYDKQPEVTARAALTKANATQGDA